MKTAIDEAEPQGVGEGGVAFAFLLVIPAGKDNKKGKGKSKEKSRLLRERLRFLVHILSHGKPN